MATIFRRTQIAGLALLLALPNLVKAQDIDLGAGGADQIWKGTEPGARAGLWLDQGAVSGTDSRRDLIVGAPGTASIPGAVYLIFGGPTRSGELLLSSAESKIISSEAGNLFGWSTAAGNIRNTEGTSPRNLVVGAPGSLGNRGAVYVFNGGFTTGSSFTDANAVLRVIGAAGDRLGTALATGDFDNDGFREIVMGAPGNNRVYIIRGSATLSGTIDLSTTPASQMINAPGIGGVLAAGDITNDNLHDLIVGAPSANLAYAFNGGRMPIAAVGAFAGVEAGDAAGTSLRILDLDGDGKRDFVITAPGADGPGNGRANAGEAYLFYGPVATTGTRSVAQANVIFYGAAAGHALGDQLSAGDINRDTPNDLVMLAPGAGAAGRLAIYYGRSVNTTGVLSGATRVVDLASPGQASRHIIGSTAVGAITSAQVFEVTGEGARDIIVGISAAEANSGKLYFTISPKLRISPTSLTFFVNQNATGSAPTAISVLNPSTVPIGWEATSNQSWLSTNVSAGTADHTHPASLNIVGNAAGLAPGTYTGRITVASASIDLEMELPINVTMRVTATKIAIDTPGSGASITAPASMAGWAADISAPSGTGVDAVHVYAYPNPGSGTPPVFVGVASYGSPRSDVGGIFGSQFTNSGYSLSLNSLGTGTYQLVAFARSTVSNSFSATATRTFSITNANPTPGPTPGPGPIPGPSPTPTPGPNTRVSLTRAVLNFASVQNGAVRTSDQTVTVNFANGASTWTATTSANWIEILGGSGSGAGSFTVRIKNGTYSAGLVLTGSITVNAPGVANSPLTLPVTFRSLSTGKAPFGVIDTPVDRVTGVTGALAFTGWALDDVEVKKVSVWRDAVPAEGTGLRFVGNTTMIDGTRPDVEAKNDLPMDYRAGWGLLILTNMLPGQGNGTYRLHAFAEDVDGHSVLLGTRTITCDNAHATRPFGTIDTPGQGGTVSGSAYINFGWVLAPQPNFIPTDGSTITVYIDGVPVGRPVYNNHRADIASLFPGLVNTNGAIGYFQFNTTSLANGLHTIAWGVTDNKGTGVGIGSRFFWVLNGSSSSSSITVQPEASIETLTTGNADVREGAAIGTDTGQSVQAVAALPEAETPSYVRSGFDPGAPLDIVDPDSDGARRVTTSEMGRLEVTVGAPISGDGQYEGYLVAGETLKPLPTGAFLDRRTGHFFWQTGVGFVGPYDFLFVRTEGGVKERIPVSVMIQPQRGERERLIPSRPIR